MVNYKLYKSACQTLKFKIKIDSDYAYGTDQQEGTSGDSQNTSEQSKSYVNE